MCGGKAFEELRSSGSLDTNYGATAGTEANKCIEGLVRNVVEKG